MIIVHHDIYKPGKIRYAYVETGTDETKIIPNVMDFYRQEWTNRPDGQAAYWDTDGEIAYYQNNLIHRTDGPAFIEVNDKGKEEYYWKFNGHDVTDEIKAYCEDLDIDPHNIPEADYLLFLVKYPEFANAPQTK